MNVTFRSDSDPDFAELERYLANGAFGQLPDAWRHQAEHDLKRLQSAMTSLSNRLPWMSPQMRKEATKFGDVHLPTRYDSPMQFRLLEGLVARIRAAVQSIGIDVEEFPHCACIPTGLVNARAVLLPTVERPFLLFDSELFLYCHLFAKAFARCLPVVGRKKHISLSIELDQVEQRLASTPELVERFRDLLHTYATTGSTSRSKQYDPESDYVHMLNILRDGMELFVVAHEFGHVKAGHLSELLSHLGLNSDELNAGNASHRQEHEADLLGLVLTLQTMASSGYDAALAYVGVELFFVSLELAERSRHMVRHGSDAGYVETSSETHPSGSERRMFLREALRLFIEDPTQVESARNLATRYGEIANLLWVATTTANPSLERTHPGKALGPRGG